MTAFFHANNVFLLLHVIAFSLGITGEILHQRNKVLLFMYHDIVGCLWFTAAV
jgi:NADH:ubiquinone oxidoreductase subunit K